MTDWARILDGANLGLTLASTTLAIAILLYAGLPTMRRTMEGGILKLKADAVLCVIANVIALSTLAFSARRVGLFATGAGILQTQPVWSKLGVILGCAGFYLAMAIIVVWRAENDRLRPGRGRVVGNLLAALSIVCTIAGGFLAR